MESTVPEQNELTLVRVDTEYLQLVIAPGVRAGICIIESKDRYKRTKSLAASGAGEDIRVDCINYGWTLLY